MKLVGTKKVSEKLKIECKEAFRLGKDRIIKTHNRGPNVCLYDLEGFLKENGFSMEDEFLVGKPEGTHKELKIGNVIRYSEAKNVR